MSSNLKVGYYYANSFQYGRHFKDVRGQCDTYLDWEDVNPTTRKVPPGKKLYVCLGLNYYTDLPPAEVVKGAIASLRGKWRRIKYMELGDEVDWTVAETHAMQRVVQEECKKAGLPCPPLGCTYTVQRIMQGMNWKTNLDWIGIEAYITYKPETTAAARKRVRKCVADQLARIGDREVVLVGQGYDRNGTWKNIDTLLAVNDETFKVAVESPKIKQLNWFAHARPGGSKSYPALLALQKSLYKSL